ncbi:hypothetical protein A9Q81_11300 [Gammaproteobacteria bacterium 42_54_T18]|nr:hypothetical protein A9Q81_11300 [Gammaproteobacteria bacterium 42_54_T18]
MKIGVFGHYGNQNLGDEAITTATIQNIQRHFPDAEIVGLSVKPDDTAERYGIDTYPIRNIKRSAPSSITQPAIQKEAAPVSISNGDSPGLKNQLKRLPVIGHAISIAGRTLGLMKKWRQEFGFLANSKRYLKDIDLIIVAGSNQFLDNFGGTWGFPYTLLKWSILCKLTNTRIAFTSIGAGPLEAPLSKFLVRVALLFADYLSYRDIASKKLVEDTIFPIDGKVYPDLAHSLSFVKEEGVSGDIAPSNKTIVAINPMPIYDSRYWCEHDDGRYKAYVGKMSNFCELLIDEGYQVQFFSTQPTDENVITDILDGIDQRLLSGIDRSLVTQCNRQVDQLMTYLDSVDIVVATRLHGTILSLLAEKPVFGVIYHRKSSDVLTDMEQGEYFVPLDDFDTKTLKSKFDVLAVNVESEKKKIIQYGQEYRQKLDKQYNEIFDLIR